MSESHQFDTTKMDQDGQEHTLSVEVTLGEEIGAGQEGTVSRALTNVTHGEMSREVPLVYKELNEPESAPILLERYHHARAAGLPVPETYRVARDAQGTTGLLITDLTDKGRNLLIGPGDAGLREQLKQEPGLLSRVQRLPLHRTDIQGNPSPIAAELASVAEHATHSGIKLFEDCMTLVLRHDNTYKLVLSDLGFVVAGDKIDDDHYSFDDKGPQGWDGKYGQSTSSLPELADYNRGELEKFRQQIADYQRP